jgi:hypothetical protein
MSGAAGFFLRQRLEWPGRSEAGLALTFRPDWASKTHQRPNVNLSLFRTPEWEPTGASNIQRISLFWLVFVGN